MILFAADNHYGVHPGRRQYEALAGRIPGLRFFEDDWRCFSAFDLKRECELIILNLIADTCGVPAPDDAAADALKAYCETGKPLLLLHGGSAAFWPFDWFRRNVGLRWVRPDDPDGVPASCHPKEPFFVRRAKCRHPLAARLVEMDLPADEIYTGLEQTAPLWILLETVIGGETFPQCTESRTEWGGKVVNFLPGHRPEVVAHPGMTANLAVLIEYLRMS